MPRLAGPRLTGLLVAALVVVIATGTSLAAWLGSRDRHLPVPTVEVAAAASAMTGPRPTPAGPVRTVPAGDPASGAGPRPSSTTSTTTAGAAGPPPPPVATRPGPAAPSVAGAPPPSTPDPPDPAGSAAAGPSTNLTVSLSAAAAADSRAPDLQAAFQYYFDAINQHDFEAWGDAVPLAQARRQNRGEWTRSYSTTVDSNITVEAIRSGTADVRFTSEQDVDFAPADLKVSCIRWTITYAVSKRGDRWVVGSANGAVLSRKSCE